MPTHRVLAVTSWGTACGIANYAQMLQEGLQQIQAPIELEPFAAGLDPSAVDRHIGDEHDLIWLNYHAGLHSRWTPSVIQTFVDRGVPIVVTYHDTYDGSETPNSPVALGIAARVAAFITHEPVSDIPQAIYLRQGIPTPQNEYFIGSHELAFHGQPVLGTVGFDFPWKNYTRLATLTAELGWAFMVLSNDMTLAREQELRQINPWLLCHRGFLPTTQIVSLLRGCTATAFMYECYNTGTSGAIRLGIAAVKPVYALQGCRQFRDLREEYPHLAWVRTWEGLHDLLRGSWPVHVDHECVYAAHRDSWAAQATRYANIFTAAIHRSGVH